MITAEYKWVVTFIEFGKVLFGFGDSRHRLVATVSCVDAVDGNKSINPSTNKAQHDNSKELAVAAGDFIALSYTIVHD